MFRALVFFTMMVVGTPAFADGEVRQTTRSAGSQAVNPAVRAAPGATLLVAGVILAPPMKSAVIVTLDSDGRETASVRVDEGETVDGYRVVAVEPDRVLFEGSGQTFTVRLGRPLPPAASAPNGPTETTERASTAELRKKAQPVLDALREHPRLRQKFEQMRPLIRQKLEESRAAGSDPHAGGRDAPPRPPASQ